MSDVEPEDEKLTVEKSFLMRVLKTVENLGDSVKAIADAQKRTDDAMRNIQDNLRHSSHVPFHSGEIKKRQVINSVDAEIKCEIIFIEPVTPDHLMKIGPTVQNEIAYVMEKYKIKELVIKKIS